MSAGGVTTSFDSSGAEQQNSERRADATVRTWIVPELEDEDPPEVESSLVRSDGEASGSSGRPSKRRKRSGRAGERGVEYYRCDNGAGIFPSWSTEETVDRTRQIGEIPDDVQIVLPKLSDRPWDCPIGYVCLYESYFRRGRLRFPLPQLLVHYCRRRRIAISQLTCSSILNLASLMLLGEELNISITLRFLEETCQIKSIKNREQIFYLSANGQRKLSLQKKGRNIRQWERHYFFVKIDDSTSSCPVSSFCRIWATRYGRCC